MAYTVPFPSILQPTNHQLALKPKYKGRPEMHWKLATLPLYILHCCVSTHATSLYAKHYIIYTVSLVTKALQHFFLVSYHSKIKQNNDSTVQKKEKTKHVVEYKVKVEDREKN